MWKMRNKPLKFLLLLLLSLSFYAEGVISNLGSLPVQTLPLISFLSIIAFFLFSFYYKFGTIAKYIFFIILYLQLISVVTLYLNNFSFLSHYIRIFISLIVGFSNFLFLSFLFRYLSKDDINDFIVLGLLVTFLLSLYEYFVLGGDRAKGFVLFSEPSHLGYYLSMITIPYILLNRHTFPKTQFAMVMVFAFLNLILTFSFTAFSALFITVFTLYMFSSKKNIFKTLLKIIMYLSSVGLFLYFLVFKLYPDNYMRLMIEYTVTTLFSNPESVPYSFSDRAQFFYILPHLINNIDQYELLDIFLLIFGHGLGSENVYFYKIFPESLHYLPEIKPYSTMLTSLQSKILIYGGLFLFTIEIFLVLALIKKLSFLNRGLCGIILGVFIYSFIGIGALAFPVIWFWLAYSEKILRERVKYKVNKVLS